MKRHINPRFETKVETCIMMVKLLDFLNCFLFWDKVLTKEPQEGTRMFRECSQ